MVILDLTRPERIIASAILIASGMMNGMTHKDSAAPKVIADLV